MANRVLDIEDLKVSFFTYAGEVQAVRGVTLHVDEGEVLAIVGESGCGKSVTAQTIMKLNPMPPAQIMGGKIQLGEHDIIAASDKEMQDIRGKDVAMIFQDPMSSLNPVMTVGDQILEVLKTHNKDMSKADLDKAVDNMMEMVGIPANRKNEYPHEFSGGMKQRIVIAIALVCEPKLILADEPTTALDVTIQAQMLGLINDLQKRLNTAMILVTHDLGVVAQTCEKVAVMYAGEVIEYGKAEHIFDSEKLHPYTRGLFDAIPKLDEDTQRLVTIDGMIPDPTQVIKGCRFADRCKFAADKCKIAPPVVEVEPGHLIKCHRYGK